MQLSKVRITPVQIGIALATIGTAVIHMMLGGWLFILNGIGYLVLGAAVLAPMPFLQQRRGIVRLMLLAYTFVTIVAYFVAHPNFAWQTDGLGLFTKLVEVILFLLLIKDSQE